VSLGVLAGSTSTTYTPPASAPRPPVDAGWDGIELIWTGWNGSVWDWTDPAGGVFVTRGGVRGLGNPRISHKRDEFASVHGALWRGLLYEPREMFFPIYLYNDVSSVEWAKFDRAFWESMHPEHEGELLVRVPGLSERTIRLRLSDDGDWQPDLDPLKHGWTIYGIRMQADQPLYAGTYTPPQSFQVDPPSNFHGGTASPTAPVIVISPGTGSGTSRLRNDGDVEGHARLTVNGPTDAEGVTVTIDGKPIEVPILLASGEVVRIDTNPTEHTAVKVDADGVETDVFDQLGEYQPAPIPKKSEVDITIVATDNATVTFEVPPLYQRAW
jgi:hypothetical protein